MYQNGLQDDAIEGLLTKWTADSEGDLLKLFKIAYNFARGTKAFHERGGYPRHMEPFDFDDCDQHGFNQVTLFLSSCCDMQNQAQVLTVYSAR